MNLGEKLGQKEKKKELAATDVHGSRKRVRNKYWNIKFKLQLQLNNFPRCFDLSENQIVISVDPNTVKFTVYVWKWAGILTDGEAAAAAAVAKKAVVEGRPAAPAADARS